MFAYPTKLPGSFGEHLHHGEEEDEVTAKEDDYDEVEIQELGLILAQLARLLSNP